MLTRTAAFVLVALVGVFAFGQTTQSASRVKGRLIKTDTPESIRRWLERQKNWKAREIEDHLSEGEAEPRSLMRQKAPAAKVRQQREALSKLRKDLRRAQNEPETEEWVYLPFEVRGQAEARKRLSGGPYHVVQVSRDDLAAIALQGDDTAHRLKEIGKGEQLLEAGSIGTIPWKKRIISVVDSKSFIAQCFDELIWFEGWDTSKMVDSSELDDVGPVYFEGTKQYDTAGGVRRTVWLVRSFKPEQYLEPASAPNQQNE